MKNTHPMEIVGEGGGHRTLFLPEAAGRGREREGVKEGGGKEEGFRPQQACLPAHWDRHRFHLKTQPPRDLGTGAL